MLFAFYLSIFNTNTINFILIIRNIPLDIFSITITYIVDSIRETSHGRQDNIRRRIDIMMSTRRFSDEVWLCGLCYIVEFKERKLRLRKILKFLRTEEESCSNSLNDTGRLHKVNNLRATR